jgi:hypothetical protein
MWGIRSEILIVLALALIFVWGEMQTANQNAKNTPLCMMKSTAKSVLEAQNRSCNIES